ncbi:enoyl-CoA hydratase/isomerase family protein [Ammoniphilus resinae]|uniref:Enoyl-CoA hydratase n=1 Tax=Ammoniphilus resinae TaxID=861532 RepID=A0ABS4GMC0_9BACL|nr:enoyl-CoA hydratase [Ammoniphilus resinae]
MNHLIKTETQGLICTITITNPPMNILTKEFREEFIPFMEQLKTSDIRVIILTGDGDRAFCAGADLNEEGELTNETVRKFLQEDCRVYDIINEMPQAVIAAVNGYAFGGGFELVLASDIRIMSERAKLCAAGVKVGLVVSTNRLVRLLGEARAKDIILTGRTVTAEEAYRMGLANTVVPHDQLLKQSMEWAQLIASRAPIAVRKAKDAIQKTLDMTWGEAMSMELDRFIECQATWDHKHAIESFFQKQQPQFKGK